MGAHFKELKLLSDTHYVYCYNTPCRFCSISTTNSYCKLPKNKIKTPAFSSTTFTYTYPKLIAQLVDTDKRSYILTYNVANANTSASEYLDVLQYTFDPKTISQQITLGSYVWGNYFYFVGTSIQIIDHLKDIDPLAYSSTTNELVVKITRILSTDTSETLSSRLDLTVDCRTDTTVPITFVSRLHYDAALNELWFTIHMDERNYQICKFNIHSINDKFDEIVAACENAQTSGYKNECKNFTESGYKEHCYILARNSSNGAWQACSSFNTSEISDNSHFGWMEYFKPYWKDPIYSVFSYDDTATPIPSEQQFSYINWKIPGVKSKADFESTLQILSTLGSSRNTAIFKNYLCYADGTSMIRVVPISCDVFYKTCDSQTKGISRNHPECGWCPTYGNGIAEYADNNTCKRPIAAVCTEIPRHINFQQQYELSTTPVDTRNETEWLTISVLFGILTMLILLARFILWNQRKVARPTYLGLNSQPLLASSTDAEENITPEISISALIPSSLQPNPEYRNLYEKIDDNIKIDISHLRLVEIIGEGHFGFVMRGTYTAPDGDIITVACKMLKEGYSGVRAFIDEGVTMMKFQHAHVLPFIGIALANDSIPIIVTKFMLNGNLLSYLLNFSNTITEEQILKFANEIAKGMEYLHSKKFIHRDLAARNCLLDYKMQLMIGDFGLARQCNDQNMYLSSNGPDMSFAWASIEALESCTFTLKLDIWSFGVVLWELMSRGKRPFLEYSPTGLLNFLKQGKRLHRPNTCPEEFYTSIMMPCWNEDMNIRPSFSQLIKQLKEFTSNSNYDSEDHK